MSPSCPTSGCLQRDPLPAPPGHSTGSCATRASPRFEDARRSFVKQLQKSQPPATRAPRNLRADTEGLLSRRRMGLRPGEGGKKSQQGACPYCCDPPRALFCYNQNRPAPTAIMLQHGAYVVLLNFCSAINQPSQFPSNIMSDGQVLQSNSLSREFLGEMPKGKIKAQPHPTTTPAHLNPLLTQPSLAPCRPCSVFLQLPLNLAAGTSFGGAEPRARRGRATPHQSRRRGLLPPAPPSPPKVLKDGNLL